MKVIACSNLLNSKEFITAIDIIESTSFPAFKRTPGVFLKGGCLILSLRIRSTHLETPGFPMGDRY